MDSIKASRRVGAEPQQNGEGAASGMQPSASAATLYSDTDGSVSKGGQTESLDGYATSEAGGNERRSLANHAAPSSSDGSLEEIVRDSPFLDLGSPMNAYEWFKVPIVAPWVICKFLLSVSGLVLVWAVTRVLVIGVKPNEVGAMWRFSLIRPWLKFWTGIFLRLGLGFWTAKVTGWDNFREAERERAICVYNHVSYVDAIVMTHFFALSGVAKAAVASIPFIGPIAVALQFLFVQRKGSADKSNKHTRQGGHTVDKIAARSVDTRFPLLMIAPEGTTKFSHCLLRFSTGAFVPGRPILPVLLKYRHKHFNVGWGITYTYWHIFRLLCQFANHLEVELMPVYYPSDEEKADPQLYSANVRKHMAQALGAELSDHSLDHNLALKKNHVHTNFLGTKVVMQA